MADNDYDYDQLFPGRFLKAGEFQGKDVTLKIARVEIEELPDKKGTIVKDGERFRVRGVISFEKTVKQLVLNKTNGECLRVLFGRKTKDWVGKRVTFYPANVEAFGEETLAIRVRGSPDIETDITAELHLGQKTRKATLKRTGSAAPNGNGRVVAPPRPAAPPPPEPVAAADPGPDDEGLDGLPQEEDLGPAADGQRL